MVLEVIPVRIACPGCRGSGYINPAPAPHAWLRCSSCDGIGTAWLTGAPSYACTTRLSDHEPGDIVTLGTGDRVKILWHMPRKTKKQLPEVTFVGEIEPFSDREDHRPIPVPSSVGVLSVDVAHGAGDTDPHDRDRAIDYGDPVQRQAAGRLI